MKNQERSLGYIVFLSFVAAIGGILFGYDTAVISGTTEIVKAQFGLSTGLEGWFVRPAGPRLLSPSFSGP